MPHYFENFVKHKVFIFSIYLFFLILIVGIIAFINIMQHFINNHFANELVQFSEKQRIYLESSCMKEIEMTLKLSSSPLIYSFFLNPNDPFLRNIAIEEILAYGKTLSKEGVIFWASDAEGQCYKGEKHIADCLNNLYQRLYASVAESKEAFKLNVDYERGYLYINAPVPDAERRIGFVSSRINLETLLSFLHSKDSSPADTAVYIFNKKGEIIPDSINDHSKKKEVLLSNVQLLESESLSFFVENNTQYVLTKTALLDWYMLIVRPIHVSLFFDNPITVIFIVMMCIIFLIFVSFNIYILTLLKPLIVLTSTMDTVISINPNPCLVTDKAHKVLYISNAMCNMTIFKHIEECRGKHISNLFDNNDIRTIIDSALQKDSYFESINKITLDKKDRFFNLIADNINSSIARRFILMNDITTIIMEGLTDPLTRLSNRRNFDICIKEEWKKAMRTKQPISFLMADLDNFKSYNDKYGHIQGDLLLKTIASIFAEAAKRPTDLALKMGGEEFVLVLPNTDIAGALKIAEHIRLEVEKAEIPIIDGNDISSITVSIGLACMIPSIDNRAEDLVSCADKFLYDAKHQGRNRIMKPQ